MASKVIYLKRNGSIDEQRSKIASDLQAKGYAVDAFSSVICVNGKRMENGNLQALTEQQAIEVISPYQADKSPEISGIRIDVVWR